MSLKCQNGKGGISEFSEYALVSIPEVWVKGDWRNPVKYVALEDLGIDPAKLKWKPMPKRQLGTTPAAEVPPPTDVPLDVEICGFVAVPLVASHNGLACHLNIEILQRAKGGSIWAAEVI
jgi:hypothetical protein